MLVEVLTTPRSVTARRRLPALAAVLAIAASACGGERQPFEFERAPIVLIDVAGLRADRIEPEPGSGEPARPLAALARDSVVFQWAFTPSPHAATARAALLSGRYPVALGLLADGGTIPEETATLAERLAEHGYRTAAFVAAPAGSPGSGGSVRGLEQGFESWEEIGGDLEQVVASAVTWLREAEAPFFLYLQASDLLAAAPGVGAPGRESPEQEQSSASTTRASTARSETLPAGAGAGVIAEVAEVGEADRLTAIDEVQDEVYDAKVRAVGAAIGALLNALDEEGLGGRAVVALTSDRGVELAERHDASAAGSVYAPVSRVPLLLRLPERLSRVEPRVTGLVDLAPTLLDLVGIEPDSAMQGNSLVAILDQRGRPPYLAFTDSIEPDGGLAVAMAGYRLVVHRGDDRAELYRLTEDPFELADLAAEEPEKVEVLRRRLEEWQRGVVGGRGGEGEGTDDEMLEQLRNLGYIQ